MGRESRARQQGKCYYQDLYLTGVCGMVLLKEEKSKEEEGER